MSAVAIVVLRWQEDYTDTRSGENVDNKDSLQVLSIWSLVKVYWGYINQVFKSEQHGRQGFQKQEREGER